MPSPRVGSTPSRLCRFLNGFAASGHNAIQRAAGGTGSPQSERRDLLMLTLWSCGNRRAPTRGATPLAFGRTEALRSKAVRDP